MHTKTEPSRKPASEALRRLTMLVHTKIMTADSYKRRDMQWTFSVAQHKEHRMLKEGLFMATNSKTTNKLNKAEFVNRTKMEDPELLKQVSSAMKKLPSHKSYWAKARNELNKMVDAYGPGTFWVTFSPGDYDDENLHEYLVKMNSDLPESDLAGMTTSQLIAKDPVLACSYLHIKFDALLDFILSEAQPLGKVKRHYVRLEYQGRLLPHFHCLFWIEDAPIIGVDSDDDVLSYIGKHITCKLPNADDDPEMAQLVKRYQFHKCNGYCLRKSKSSKGKARCKFSFPRQPSSKPVLHSVLSSVVSRKSSSFNKRLVELERMKSEERINDYNPILLSLWKVNMDIQFIGEDSGTVVDYITKYCTKAPKSNLTEFNLSTMTNDKSEYSKLLSLCMSLMRQREMGAMEARNIIMAEKAYRTDAKFQFVNAVASCKRKQVLKRRTAIEKLPDDSTDLFFAHFTIHHLPWNTRFRNHFFKISPTIFEGLKL